MVEITQQENKKVTEQEEVVGDVTQEDCEDKKKWCPCMEDECHKASIRAKCPETCQMCESGPVFSSTRDTSSSKGNPKKII